MDRQAQARSERSKQDVHCPRQAMSWFRKFIYHNITRPKQKRDLPEARFCLPHFHEANKNARS